MRSIVIREACGEDALQILSYLKQIGAETDSLTFGPEGLPVTPEAEQTYIRSVQADPHSVMLLALRDGKIVGDGSLSSLPRRMAHRAEVGIAVVKAEWDRGIGSLLMEALIGYAREHGIEILNLEVRADNAKAIHLYEEFGFRRIGVSPGFLKLENTYADFLLMFLDLR